MKRIDWKEEVSDFVKVVLVGVAGFAAVAACLFVMGALFALDQRLQIVTYLGVTTCICILCVLVAGGFYLLHRREQRRSQKS
jgi:hypothetical protein